MEVGDISIVMRFRTALAGASVAVLFALSGGMATADPVAPVVPPAPQAGAACPAELADVMTLLADGQTYVACSQVPGGYAWAQVQTPFEPHDAWLSYGPAITLHGQGMRNPNLTSGSWTATPLDPDATCRAEEQTVVEAGVLTDPQVFQGDQGKAVAVPMLPKLFYLQISGHCLWTRT